MRARTALALLPIALLVAAAVSFLLWKVARSSKAAGSTPGGSSPPSSAYVTTPAAGTVFSLEIWVTKLPGYYLVNRDGTGLRKLVGSPTEAAWQPSP